MTDRIQILHSPMRIDYDPEDEKHKLYHIYMRCHSKFTFDTDEEAKQVAQAYFMYILHRTSMIIGDWVVPLPMPNSGRVPTMLLKLFDLPTEDELMAPPPPPLSDAA
jgi:hypothetical protein